MSVLERFCHVDDFCRTFDPRWHEQCLMSDTKRRNRARELARSAAGMPHRTRQGAVEQQWYAATITSGPNSLSLEMTPISRTVRA